MESKEYEILDIEKDNKSKKRMAISKIICSVAGAAVFTGLTGYLNYEEISALKNANGAMDYDFLFLLLPLDIISLLVDYGSIKESINQARIIKKVNNNQKYLNIK